MDAVNRGSMKLLLDTHAFIWWDSQSSRPSAQALAACADPANELFLSVASTKRFLRGSPQGLA